MSSKSFDLSFDPNETRDFQSDVSIDKDNLEEEWILHSSLYLYYSTQYAKATFQKDQAKSELEWITAELDLEIRSNPRKYGFPSKPTEGGIKNTIIVNKKYQEASEKFNKKTRLFNVLTGVKTALEHRKHALGNLVALKIGGFYSEPRNIVKDVKTKQGAEGQAARKAALNESLKRKNG